MATLYDKDTDYSQKLKELMDSRASANEVGDALSQRTAKATSESGLSQYANDDVYDTALKYIANYKQPKAVTPSVSTSGGYQSPYTAKIDELMSSLTNTEKFTYDPESDPLYQNYKTQYTGLGQKAMQNTIGQVAARTGGLASSYAASAGAQANNAYMQELTDKIPELQQLAYSMYNQDLSQKQNSLGLLQNADALDYSKYRDTVSDNQYAQSLAYQQQRDATSDSQWQQSFLYQQQQDSLDRAAQQDATTFSNAMAKWQVTGTLDAESAKVLGIPEGTKTSDYAFSQAQLALDKAQLSLSQSSAARAASNEQYSRALEKAQTLAAKGDYSGYKALGYTDAEIDSLEKGATSGSETYGTLYQGMMSSDDPQKWLTENADWLSNDEIEWLYKRLPDTNDAFDQWLMQKLSE